MCLIVGLAVIVAGWNFYDNGYMIQASMSFVAGSAIVGFFIYRMIKNRECIFGGKGKCHYSTNELSEISRERQEKEKE